MTIDRYPIETELDYIKEFKDFWSNGLIDKAKFHSFMAYVKSIGNYWPEEDFGWHQEEDTYNVSTGGWSGNESIISALKENYVFWSLFWKQERAGGHYVFKPWLTKEASNIGFYPLRGDISKDAPRAFVLQRDEDVTGVSGTGIVAWGVEFPDGVVALRWKSEWPTSVVFHERGIKSVEAVHGHNGKTRIVWI